MRDAIVERHRKPQDTSKKIRKRVSDIISEMRKAGMYVDRVAVGDVKKVWESKADFEKRVADKPSDDASKGASEATAEAGRSAGSEASMAEAASLNPEEQEKLVASFSPVESKQ